MPRGRVFVFEGGDGVGKTTLWRNFSNALGDKAEFFREPGGTHIGDALRTILLQRDDITSASQLLMFMAARFQLIEQFILPAIQSGKDVFLDRFDASTYAYQICGNNVPWLKEVFSELRKRYLSMLGSGESFQPTYIWLNLDPAVALSRMKGRNEPVNHFDLRESEYHQRVRDGYETFFEQYAKERIVIDAGQSIKDVFCEVSEIVAPHSLTPLNSVV